MPNPNNTPPWTVDPEPNPAASDAWVNYHTLRWCGLVRGQLSEHVAPAICLQLNLGNVDGHVDHKAKEGNATVRRCVRAYCKGKAACLSPDNCGLFE